MIIFSVLCYLVCCTCVYLCTYFIRVEGFKEDTDDRLSQADRISGRFFLKTRVVGTVSTSLPPPNPILCAVSNQGQGVER